MSAKQDMFPIKNTDLVTSTIIANGNPLDSTYKILSILVCKEINRIPYAKITLLDGEVADQDFNISNSDILIPGTKIEILSGYHSDEKTIFKGIIITHGLKIRKNKVSVLEIVCKDQAVRLSIGKKSAYYYESSDSDIMEEIIGVYGIEKDVYDTGESHKELIQYNVTDWDFIISRSEMNSCLVIVNDGKVSIKPPILDQEPVLKLIYGSTLHEFEAEYDARNQIKSAKSLSWDPASQELLEVDAENQPDVHQGNLDSHDLANVIDLPSYVQSHSGKLDDKEMSTWANAKLLKSRMSKIRGRVKSQGFSDIIPGNVVELEGVGERFNGKAFVSGVRHEISDGDWFTNIQIGLNNSWFYEQFNTMDAPAAGLLSAVHGLHTGVVTQLQEDPEGEYRIKVKVPVINNNEDGIWARIACLDAGTYRGIFFMPEINDEVIIGYINDDPRDPVILGMLNSSAKPAPFEPNDDNHEKGLITRSKIKVTFNDEKKIIAIETPSGKQFIMDEDTGEIKISDENKNCIIMNSDGINIESDKNITLKAGNDIIMEGNNIIENAQMAYKAKGSSSTEISSGGTLTVKGSLVQIN